MTRQEILDRLRQQVQEGRPIIGTGAGIGLSAKCAEAAGIDLIIIYNSGRYRMAGRGSMARLMPYGDANAIVMEMAGEVLPVVKHTPVLAGVCGTDPFRLMPVFLRQLREMRFAGVQNFPTVCLYDGIIRRRLDLLTVPYAASEDEARAMTAAGADVLVAHMGLTTSGMIGALTAITLDEAVERVQALRDAAKSVNPDIMVLCHGRPIASASDAAYVLDRTKGVGGFFGASSMERLPTEVALTEHMRQFKEIPVSV